MYLMRESPKKILFVCVGNMCRSPMAEGFARAWAEGRVEVHSAGTHAAGEISTHAVTAMAEAGIDIGAQWSKGFEEVNAGMMDVVVSMAGRSVTAFLPPKFAGRLLVWRIADPVGQPLEAFREARDAIEPKVRALLNEILSKTSRD